MRSIQWICLSAVLGVASGCSLQKLAVNQTAKVLKAGLPAFEKESDYEFGAAALPGAMKTVEALLQTVPDNEDLLITLARGYTAYGMLVLEDKLESLDSTEQEEEHTRMAGRVHAIHMRAHVYGLRLVETRREGFRKAFDKGREALKAALAECDKDDVPGLFWAALPLASAINAGQDDVWRTGVLPKARALMERVVELDETYYFGSAHLVLGAVQSIILGGSTKKSQEHFEKALKLNKRRFLLAIEMYARTLAVKIQDKELFKRLLKEVIDADLNIFPEQVLANIAAKRRARRTLAKIDEFF